MTPNFHCKNTNIIITGTDPLSNRGGIGFALLGYLAAMDSVGVVYKSIPTYHPSVRGGRCWWWLKRLPFLCKLIFASRCAGNNVIVYSHAGAGVSLLREGIILAFSSLCGAKTIMQLHAPEINGYLAHPLKSLLFRLAILPTSAIAVLTPWWRDRLGRAGISKRTFVIPNPLPIAWEKKARVDFESFPQKKGDVTILALSRIEPGKGVDLLIETIPLLPESVRLVVAGDGSQLSILQHRVQVLGIEGRVEFKGWVAGEEKQHLFDEADLFCLPSSYDSFGMGFLEAMANGLPVVALDWGAISDVVADNHCGVLIRKKNPQALAEAIVRLLDPSLRQHMSRKARRWVIDQFGAEKVGPLIRLMFEQVLAQ